MTNENLLKILDHIIAELIEVNRTLPVIVEGESDEKSLRNLGLKGTILRLNIGLQLFNFCENLTEYSEIIILTDWDRKGKELRQKLKQGLNANGIKANDSYWLGLKHLCSREIKVVEQLDNFMLRLRNGK